MKGISLPELKEKLRPHLKDLLGNKALGLILSQTDRMELQQRLELLAEKTMSVAWRDQLTEGEREALVRDLLDETIGLGPLEDLIRDPSVAEIMVNGPSCVFVERYGRIERTDLSFQNRDHLTYIIEKILAPTSRMVTQSMPTMDARLPDGSRVSVAIEPIAVDGPYLTIRKTMRELLSLGRLVQLGSLTSKTIQFLRLCIKGRLNIVISGPASSGKTTLLNALAGNIPIQERVVLIEDPAEIQLPGQHVVRLEARPANIEGQGEITIRSLVKRSLHMRPDRIIISEVRGSEALDMLQAMNTGHDGSMTTLHANSPEDVLDRIETLALMSHIDLSPLAIERQVRSAVDLIIQINRFQDGRRKVTHICEVRKGKEAPSPPLTDLFLLQGEGSDTQRTLQPTGLKPAFLDQFTRAGLEIPPDLFTTSI